MTTISTRHSAQVLYPGKETNQINVGYRSNN